MSWQSLCRPLFLRAHTCGVAAQRLLVAAMWCLPLVAVAAAAEPQLKPAKGDHIVLIGNTLAERMQYFGHFETLLHSRFPELELVVRNLGWSADELTLRPRSKDFQDHGHRLEDHQADVVLAFFGFNESFAGQAGLPKFEKDLEKFITETKAAKYNGRTNPRLVLFSPIAHENLGNPHLPDGVATNKNLELYTAAMQKAAAKHGVGYVDLLHPTKKLMAGAEKNSEQKLTINGVHLNEHGDKLVARVMDEGLFGPRASAHDAVNLETLRAEVNEKNLQHFYDHRAVNGYYIYGGRKNPFGVVNFPAEFAKLRKMIAVRDARIWAVAQGKQVPEKIDDSGTGEFTKIETNMKTPISLTSPEQSRQKMTLAPGYEVNLFASEVEFPELENPVQFAFDARGRLWVTTMGSYPMYLPGTPVNDKILILEDTNGDGRADKQTVFADGLHVPTGIELGDGGAYVAQQPNLVFLKDTDGDDRADVRENLLHGFDSADSHHSISAFTWDQGGAMYFEEGTFHHTQVETPYGPERCMNAGVFRWEPRTSRFDVFVSYNFANPWGHVIDRWGQNFVADASGGANYYGTAFSGDVDYPTKHGGLKQFLTKQWRPTAGCELVSSRNFPDDAQGNYLLNNCIGFQGVLQYKMREDGSGFAADPVDPLLRSEDPNFRPVDIEFGPDGALYLCDWFNPLVGHMQHSIRDPNRDKKHGRIWRVRYKDRPLTEPAKIAGQSASQLIELLMTAPEERTCYRVRTELRSRDANEVLAAAAKFLASCDKTKPEFEHHRLEALWLAQQYDQVNAELLRATLASPDYRARAAATRVLCYWRDRVDNPLALLAQQVGDEHPRVRLEAVRALSFFDSELALATALSVYAHPLDDYITYTLKETVNTLEHRLKQRQPAGGHSLASGDASPVQPLLKLVQGGKLPADRLETILEMVIDRGDARDLAQVLAQAVRADGFPRGLRLQAFDWLADAATARKLKPEGDLSALEALLASPAEANDRELRRRAIRLGAVWKLTSLVDDLRAIALNDKSAVELKQSAIDGLATIGDATSRSTLDELASASHAMAVRYLAASGLTRLDLDAAAKNAAAALAKAAAQDDPTRLLEAFLNRKGGPDKLAAALSAGEPLSTDVAKVLLRHMYSIGRSDASLSDVLSKAAGIAADAPPPTAEEISKLAVEVATKGDAARGEQIFRREDLSCLKCHAVSKAGGSVGPELSAVGSISPVDYILNSILNPNLAIKEQYVTKVIVTADGETFTGIAVDRDDVRLRLRDASGKVVTIPVADIDVEAEGKSLMPQGLTKFLTHDELIDLAKFVSELGKPGPYAIRSTPTIQRWRVLKNLPGELTSEWPNNHAFRLHVTESKSEAWTVAYSQAAGTLPLAELRPKSGPKMAIVQGEIDVVVPGEIEIGVQSTDPTIVWVDAREQEKSPTIKSKLNAGRHRITIRVALGDRESPELKVELKKAPNSKIQFEPVGGT